MIFLNCELFNIPPAGESMTMHGMWVDKYNESPWPAATRFCGKNVVKCSKYDTFEYSWALEIHIILRAHHEPQGGRVKPR